MHASALHKPMHKSGFPDRHQSYAPRRGCVRSCQVRAANGLSHPPPHLSLSYLAPHALCSLHASLCAFYYRCGLEEKKPKNRTTSGFDQSVKSNQPVCRFSFVSPRDDADGDAVDLTIGNALWTSRSFGSFAPALSYVAPSSFFVAQGRCLAVTHVSHREKQNTFHLFA